MTLKRKMLLIIIGIIIVLPIILCAVFIDNKNVDYENFTVSAENLITAGLKIAHLSDLHFSKIKVDTDKMLQRIEDEKVDFIAITGDIIDSTADVNSCGVAAFIEKAVKVAPVYYVNGNHERNHPQEYLLYDILRSNGVIILQNESVSASFGDKKITIIGLIDDEGYNCYNYTAATPEIKENYRVLLAHRPERRYSYISSSNEFPPHLVLTGHAHGGQIRFFGQGLVAPNQGFFPKFDSGLYSDTVMLETDTQTVNMIVSRGIGNSIIPYRFNNKPHVPIINIV